MSLAVSSYRFRREPMASRSRHWPNASQSGRCRRASWCPPYPPSWPSTASASPASTSPARRLPGPAAERRRPTYRSSSSSTTSRICGAWSVHSSSWSTTGRSTTWTLVAVSATSRTWYRLRAEQHGAAVVFRVAYALVGALDPVFPATTRARRSRASLRGALHGRTIGRRSGLVPVATRVGGVLAAPSCVGLGEGTRPPPWSRGVSQPRQRGNRSSMGPCHHHPLSEAAHQALQRACKHNDDAQAVRRRVGRGIPAGGLTQ